ncbi:response regulator [Sphingomonas sp. SORGH_AS_0879]|uniref:response regulator n=1 Tax=Sphingomonas sp. SORGH_AS_0879 TaxID=3041790 RepID=UPI002780D063|nr:response regulator [Sphingomonas sp. SORGH_AS_0879]MDQ1230865.1 DNA-binding response OmpR family regulator [Sphingomonas sp. SORGH_AS_0879]
MKFFGRKKPQLVKLLVVEDEPLVAFDTEHVLVDADYEIVATVDQVSKAVTLIEGGTAIDLVLADVRLADGSGVDVARAAHARDIPVLFLTGTPPDGVEDLAEGILMKPYGSRELLGAIAAIEERRTGKSPGRLPAGFRLFARA